LLPSCGVDFEIAEIFGKEKMKEAEIIDIHAGVTENGCPERRLCAPGGLFGISKINHVGVSELLLGAGCERVNSHKKKAGRQLAAGFGGG